MLEVRRSGGANLDSGKEKGFTGSAKARWQGLRNSFLFLSSNEMLGNRSKVKEIISQHGPDELVQWPYPSPSMQGSQWRAASKAFNVSETKVSWGAGKEQDREIIKKEQTSALSIIPLIQFGKTWPSTHCQAKDRKATVHVRRCFFLAPTWILQKGHYKQSLPPQKALNGATEIYAGVAPPGKVRGKSRWDEVTEINWILESIPRADTGSLVQAGQQPPPFPESRAAWHTAQ